MPRPAALLPLLCAGAARGEESKVTVMHGSGTTNPSKLFWKVMGLFEEEAKQPLHMTYRAVGSSTGQKEFVGDAGTQLNHFGSGDIPMTKERYDAVKASGREMVHVPFVLGAISFFHSIPGIPVGGLQVDGCTLAKIFARTIKTWDHPDILARNPTLLQDVPGIAGQNIQVVHRVHGSSSTAGATEYMKKACPSGWPLDTGSKITWPSDTVDAQGSDGVADYIAGNPYSIGYIDSGHGHKLGLSEIHLRNKNGVYLTSKQADIGAAATSALSGLPAGDGDWSSVNLYDQSGATTWPITMWSYFYVDKDMTALGSTGTLVRAFVDFILSDIGQGYAESEFGFTRVPPLVLEKNRQTMGLVTVSAQAEPWSFEQKDTTLPWVGAGAQVLSKKRRSFAEYERTHLNSDVEELKDTLARMQPGVAIPLHGSGTTNPSKLFWKVMDLFEEESKQPVRMTYRAVGSSTGQKEFVGNDGAMLNHFGSGDIPMTKDRYDAVKASGRDVLHVPFVLGAISFFHSIPGIPASGLQISGCTLAKVFARTIKTWDHPEILAANPTLLQDVPGIAGQNIQVVHRVHGSSSTAGATEYMKKACPSGWPLDTGAKITWPVDTVDAQGSDGVADYIAGNAYSIGYIDSGHGHKLGLSEIHLRNKDGVYLTSKEADIGAAATAALSGLPAGDGDWSSVNLYDQTGPTTWPITMWSYFYLQKDMTQHGDTGTLLSAFVQFVLSDVGQGYAETEFGFTRVPPLVLQKNAQTLGMMLTKGAAWDFEEKGTTRPYDGSKTYMLSKKRRSFAEYERSHLNSNVEELQAAIADLRTSQVVALHGSGTTNPSKLFWKAMDLFEEESKQPLRMTYRAVGSSTGQKEFTGDAASAGQQLNHFGSGDIPMTKDRYDAVNASGRGMLHVPFVLGAISFFHSIPGSAVTPKGLQIDGCTLAKIFARTITTWDHPDILAANPTLLQDVPGIAGQNIQVVHRVHGSSSTAGATEYMKKACPGGWPLDTGSKIAWPADTIDAQGSDGVADYIQSHPYSIGYIDSGHGHKLGLSEIHLRNKDGVYLTSKQADIGAAATSALSSLPPGDGDWSSVNLYDQSGPTTWPITMWSYFYIDKDMSQYGDTGTLLKAFAEFILGPVGQAYAEEFGFTRVPPLVLLKNADTLGMMVTRGAAWDFEEKGTTRPYAGSGSHMLSKKRRSFAEYERYHLSGDIDRLKSAVSMLQSGYTGGGAITDPIHGYIDGLQADTASLKAQLHTLQLQSARNERSVSAVAGEVQAVRGQGGVGPCACNGTIQQGADDGDRAVVPIAIAVVALAAATATFFALCVVLSRLRAVENSSGGGRPGSTRSGHSQKSLNSLSKIQLGVQVQPNPVEVTEAVPPRDREGCVHP